jgi:hypothetical protein
MVFWEEQLPEEDMSDTFILIGSYSPIHPSYRMNNVKLKLENPLNLIG